MNLFKHYIQYRLKAKGIHGIHSPFVYAFVNECLCTKIDKKFLSKRKILFKILKNNPLILEINDFGAGSKKLGYKRKVSDIFKTSSSRGKYSLLLYKLSSFYSPEHIVELGTSLGIGAIHLKAGNVKTKLTTIEACGNTLTAARKNFKFFDFESIHSIHSTFDDFFRQNDHPIYDLVFIDGHHDGKALERYLEQLKSHTHNETIFILDDIRWSDSMFLSWTKIINDPHFHVSIDLFRMGIIIPRIQQEKEHFTIKF